jgi:hypothetical protein
VTKPSWRKKCILSPCWVNAFSLLRKLFKLFLEQEETGLPTGAVLARLTHAGRAVGSECDGVEGRSVGQVEVPGPIDASP